MKSLAKRTVFLLIIFAGFLSAQDAKEIIKNAENIIKGESSTGTMKMEVITPDFSRTLEMDTWWVGNEKALLVVKSPRREEGNKTLKIGNEMWNYLKNTETTIKVPTSMLLQSWNGSDFTNDDLVRESSYSEDFYQKIMGEETINNEICWKIRLLSKPESPVVWGKLIYFVRKKDNMPSRIDFYDEEGNLVRKLHFKKIIKMDGRLMPTVWEMESIAKEGHLTRITMKDIKFDVKISDRIFSFRELERGN